MDKKMGIEKNMITMVNYYLMEDIKIEINGMEKDVKDYNHITYELKMEKDM